MAGELYSLVGKIGKTGEIQNLYNICDNENDKKNRGKLELARLIGIKNAINKINKIPGSQRNAFLGKIKQISLPFSADPDRNADGSTKQEISEAIQQIEEEVKKIGLGFAAEKVDALKPKDGFVVATTNCGDPHAMIGNEGGYHSVDAAISSNCPSTIRLLDAFYNSSIHSTYLSKVDTIAKGFEMLQIEPDKNRILRNFILSNVGEFGLNRGQWSKISSNPIIEIGISGSKGLPAITSDLFQVDLQADGTLDVFSKTKQDENGKFAQLSGQEAKNALMSFYNFVAKQTQYQLPATPSGAVAALPEATAMGPAFGDRAATKNEQQH